PRSTRRLSRLRRFRPAPHFSQGVSVSGEVRVVLPALASLFQGGGKTARREAEGRRNLRSGESEQLAAQQRSQQPSRIIMPAASANHRCGNLISFSHGGNDLFTSGRLQRSVGQADFSYTRHKRRT